MPAHKYYCDYCDKQFYDTPASRKRHLQGISHQRAQKQWFDSFRGTCQYGNQCRFEHPGPPMPVHFGSPAAEGQYANINGTNTGASGNPLPVMAGTASAPELALANFLLRDLPPSLRPPPEGGYGQLVSVDWG